MHGDLVQRGCESAERIPVVEGWIRSNANTDPQGPCKHGDTHHTRGSLSQKTVTSPRRRSGGGLTVAAPQVTQSGCGKAAAKTTPSSGACSGFLLSGLGWEGCVGPARGGGQGTPYVLAACHVPVTCIVHRDTLGHVVPSTDVNGTFRNFPTPLLRSETNISGRKTRGRSRCLSNWSLV